MNFQNKTALITGGSSGIGLSLARLLAEKGSNVWLLARDSQKLNQALELVKASASSTEQHFKCISADVSNREQVTRAIQDMILDNGAPDILINSAGMIHPGYVHELDLDIYHREMDVNYFGTVNVTRAVLPSMIQRGSGHIVNISSVAGFLAVVGYSSYSPTKFAVRGFSDVLRMEMKPLGIKVSCVFPPDTDTPELAYEKQHRPYELANLNSNLKEMQPEQVAKEILRGVQNGTYIILPGWDAKWTYWLSCIMGSAGYFILDVYYNQARKKHP